MVNEQGDIETQLEAMESKIGGIVREANIMGGYETVGNMEVSVKLLLYDKTITKTVFYNMEAWTNLRQGDKQRLEVIQGKILKKLLNIPKSTPYWGLLIELGIWPVEWYINYRKLMLLHNLFHSDDERLAKQVMVEQKQSGQENCWYSEVKEIIELLQIHHDPEEMTKQEWKKITKDAIYAKVEVEAKTKSADMKKLRFVRGFAQGFKQKDYLTEMTAYEAKKVLKIRLNMTLNIAGNIGKKEVCKLCNIENETTEHVFYCTGVDNKDNLKHDDLQSTDTNTLRKTLELFEEYEKQQDETSKMAKGTGVSTDDSITRNPMLK